MSGNQKLKRGGDIPPMFDFTDDERFKVERWLDRMMIHFEFRMEELGPPSEIDAVRQWQQSMRRYWKHCRKFCRFLKKGLACRDRLDPDYRD